MLDYLKLFQEWFKLKLTLWTKPSKVIFKQGEIWWCSLGMNVGEEEYGKGPQFTRPVLIFRKFTNNSFMGLPLTTQEKTGTWYVETELGGIKRKVMLNQARLLDKKRLTSKVGVLDKKQFNEVRVRFLKLFSS